MALDRAMHPRNRYRDKPPDFSFLASKYPDFSQYIHVDLAGNVKLNFKDPEAVRALTCTLLKEDFGLTVEIPLQRLIPTIPLRLNYIHWVEDLMETMGIKAQGPGSHAFIRGIDIGTGTSCIYPLLGATMNGWHFLATEVDDVCYSHACCNVERNRLQDLIQVVKVPEKTLLLEALKENPSVMYDFCMCNPPFFATAEEAKGAKSRSAHRPPPSSVNTGGNTEILAEGGELEFVRRIIQDSLHLMKRLRWYTCMLGKKCSLAPLKEELRRCGVPRVTSTVFCQGRTSRWALAWTFYTDVSIPSPPPKRRKMEKLKRPFTISLPSTVVEQLLGQNGPSVKDSVQEVCRFLEKVLAELKISSRRRESWRWERTWTQGQSLALGTSVSLKCTRLFYLPLCARPPLPCPELPSRSRQNLPKDSKRNSRPQHKRCRWRRAAITMETEVLRALHGQGPTPRISIRAVGTCHLHVLRIRAW
uniref:RNA N(6)-adenosine-methyltransferase METTL16 n=1 Tax=Eptatretus burgeri TaxID=7764 RepID=A0A8C4NBI2_EPTBU